MRIKLLVCLLSISLLASHDAFAFLPLSPGTIIIQQITSTGGSKQGTYNTTLANNAVINQGGYKLNFINGTGNPINVKNSTNGMVNVTIGLTGSMGVTSLNALTGALTISCVSGNTTCTSSGGNTITVNTAYNIVTTGLAAQTISKQLTINNLILGGDENVGSNALTNGGHKSTLLTTTGTLCQTNQTSHCGTDLFNGTITSINSQTGPTINLVRGSPGNITITNSSNLISIDTGQNIANLATTNNQTFSGKVNFTATSKLAGFNFGSVSATPSNFKNGDCYYNSATNLYRCEEAGSDRAMMFNNDGNTFVNKLFLAGPTSGLADITDTTKQFKWLLSGMTAGKVLTLRSNQTTSQGLNIPNIPATDTLATLGIANTFSNNQTISTGQNVYMGTANITTTAVRGYLYLSVTDGTPTGTPASHTGGVPVLFDGKTNRLCIYNSGWKCVQLS